MITEFSTFPKKLYYVQTSEACTVLDADGDTLAEISAPGGYFPGIGAPDSATGTVTFSPAVKRVIGPFDLAPQLQLTLLGLLGGNRPVTYTPVEWLEGQGTQYCSIPVAVDGSGAEPFACVSDIRFLGNSRQLMGFSTNATYYWGVPANNAGFELGGGHLLPASVLSRNSVRFTRVQRVATLECNGQGVSRITDDLVGPFSAYGLLNPAVVLHEGINVCQARVYGVQIYENNILTRTLVPALDSVGAACFYDKISGEAFYNEGTGDFATPGQEQEASTFSLRRTVTLTYAQLTAHGVRRLYKVPRGYNGTKEEYAMENGFKPLVETPQPEVGYWLPQWRETAEEIVLDWVETEPPAEEIEPA